METQVIRYNLKDRGRKHTGQPRDFNIRAICDAINSPAVQETVSSRGMLGYYGHAPRIRYGMQPVEGGFEAGRYKEVEPAIVTTYLKADYDGNVEHRAEFLDTAAGQLAKKLWEGKVGGFSSAIDQGKPAFYGFDYVAQPNFLSNSFRGIALDDIFDGIGVEEISYDDVYSAEREETDHAEIIAGILDSVTAERDATSAVIERLQSENDQYLSILSSRGIDASAVLDAVAIRPVVVDVDPLERMRRDSQEFMDAANLPGYVPEEDGSAVLDSVPLYSRLLSKLSR